MKHLKETTLGEYEASRNLCVDPTDIEDQTPILFIARFINDEASMAVEGLVSARRVDDNHINFNHADDDGQTVGEPYLAPIDGNGIIGRLALRDGASTLMQASEGYLRTYRDKLDDEFTDVIATMQRELVPVHVTMGGASADSAKRQLGIEP